MKKIVSLLLICFCMFFVIGCGINNPSLNQEERPQEEQEEKQDEDDEDNKGNEEDEEGELQLIIEVFQEHDFEFFDGSLKTTLEFPSVVQQGESFVINIVTQNISYDDFEWWTSSTHRGKGIVVNYIRNAASDRLRGPVGQTDDLVRNSLGAGESLEWDWEFSAKTNKWSPPNNSWTEDAPKGFYDIYLTNGEVYRNAIKVV